VKSGAASSARERPVGGVSHRALLTKATRALKRGQVAAARKACEKVLAQDPANDQALQMLAAIAWRTGDSATAEKHLRAAIPADKKPPQALSRLAQFLIREGRHEEALPLLERALAQAPERPELENGVGGVLVELGRPEAAIAHFRRAVALKPSFPDAHHNLGAALHDLGQMPEAEECYRRAIRLKPDYTAAYRHMSRIKKFKPDDPDIAAMKGLLEKASLGPDGKIALHFALAKAYEDIGEYEQAFGHLNEANQSVRRGIVFSIEDQIHTVTRLIGAFDRELFSAAAGQGFESDTPIFIVGMPRSGTTMVEQILASHPDVEGAGELTVISGIDKQLGAWLPKSCTSTFPESVASVRPDGWREAGMTYVDGIEAYRHGAHRVTDKMPFNFLWIGLIHLMLPNATIVHVTRDPMDTCLSCYKQHFIKGALFYYDLTELGRYYHCCYQRIMAHWHAVLPGRVFDVRYEDIVSDPKSTIASLLNHCRLSWSDSCLRFHETERSVQTASAAQVRQPLYATSVKLWERYAGQLEPLQRALDRPCEA